MAWKLWLSLCVFGTLVYGAAAQKTYSRACQCEKVINGQCAYTLLLPIPGKVDGENGVCPTSGDGESSSPGDGSTGPPSEEVQEKLEELNAQISELRQNVSTLDSWTGEQAKTLVTLQNVVNAQNMILASIQAGALPGGMPSEENKTSELYDSLNEVVTTLQEMFQTLSTTVAEQTATVTSMAQAAQESLDSIEFSREQLIEADNKIGELSRLAGSLEEQLTDLKSNYYLCKSKGLLVSGRLQSIPDSSIVGSSTFDEKHTPDRVRINTESDDQAFGAWCPSEPNQDEEWIQVNLGISKLIFGIITRGRADYAQWVTSYSLQYADTPFAGADPVYVPYLDVLGDTMIFEGNSDQTTAKTNMLWQPISAQYVRIVPLASYENRNKCMRADLIGCVDAS